MKGTRENLIVPFAHVCTSERNEGSQEKYRKTKRFLNICVKGGLKKKKKVAIVILRERRDSRAFFGGWFFPAVCLFLAIGVTFTPPRLTKFCHVHGIVLIAQWEKRGIEKLAFLGMKVGTRVMILARNSKNCSFSSRKRRKNITFSVPSYRMTIHTFESAKKWSECGIFQELQLIFWGNPVLQWCRVFYLALRLIAIQVWIRRMLIDCSFSLKLQQKSPKIP